MTSFVLDLDLDRGSTGRTAQKAVDLVDRPRIRMDLEPDLSEDSPRGDRSLVAAEPQSLDFESEDRIFDKLGIGLGECRWSALGRRWDSSTEKRRAGRRWGF